MRDRHRRIVGEQAAADVAAGCAHRAHQRLHHGAPAHRFDTEDRAVHPLVRLSPHYYNTEAEIDRAAAELAVMAR